MSDDFRPHKPRAVLEPGTLENTRRNIGLIDAEEAAKMTKILGGEILTEKSVPIDYSKLPKRPIQRNHVARATGKTSASGSVPSSAGAALSSTHKEEPKKNVTRTANLPSISSKDNQLIDKLMMSPEYGIKKNYGFLNFLKGIQKDGRERFIPEFAEITLKCHMEHINAFITVMKTFIQLAPDTYKAKIQNETELKFKFLRTVAAWSTRDIKLTYINLETLKGNVVVADLIPFVKMTYRLIITVLYLGEATVNRLVREIYTDMIKYPKADQEKFSKLSKEALTEWMYIYVKIARGMYPLLMRMCGTPYEEFNRFFVTQISTVLNFVGLKKFDILLPEKKVDPEAIKKAREEEERKAKEEQKKRDEEEEARLKNDMVDTGLNLLDKLFPQAGFLHLDSFPDLYGYFDPLYDFDDEFVYVAPENPIQITLVLARIIEDFLNATHNMKFEPEQNEALTDPRDNFVTAIGEWPLYREDLFDKKYAPSLKQLVDQTYTQANFGQTQVGKKVITDLYWMTKWNFLPQFTFDQLLLERPINDNKYIALNMRTSFFRRAFTYLTQQIASAEASKGSVGGLENPWEHYQFDFPSPVSRRLDVLLNGKNKGANCTATNANLIKYLVCIVSVLDWWVNAKGSPAYKTDPKHIYRTMPGSNEPAFSVEARNDQDKLFAEAIKNSVQKKAE